METTNKSSTVVKSPLSELPARKIRELPRAFLLERLEAYYGARPPAAAVENDYSLWQCVETGLEFAWPLVQGNTCFYEWVSGFASYYPGIRWEYGQVRHLLETDKPGDGDSFKVLDVGCGKGDFLRGLDLVRPDCKFALDLNEPAVEACRKQGFRAFCGTMETAIAAGFVKKSEFPVVTSFHCLEHVEDPVNFVRSLMQATARGGRVYISTPYSPMSFESEWFDILNHPPHHLTRWNLDAYRRLADVVGAKMRHFVPHSSAVRRAITVFRGLRHGPTTKVGKARLLADMACHIPTLVSHYRKQRMRGHKNDGVAADVILVELTIL